MSFEAYEEMSMHSIYGFTAIWNIWDSWIFPHQNKNRKMLHTLKHMMCSIITTMSLTQSDRIYRLNVIVGQYFFSRKVCNVRSAVKVMFPKKKEIKRTKAKSVLLSLWCERFGLCLPQTFFATWITWNYTCKIMRFYVNGGDYFGRFTDRSWKCYSIQMYRSRRNRTIRCGLKLLFSLLLLLLFFCRNPPKSLNFIVCTYIMYVCIASSSSLYRIHKFWFEHKQFERDLRVFRRDNFDFLRMNGREWLVSW